MIEALRDEDSRAVQLDANDLVVPSSCAVLHAPILVIFGDFGRSAQPWLVGSPDSLAAREKNEPSMRDRSGRTDGLLVHQVGGYLTSQDFTIQCRSTELMGLDGPNHFVRCRLADADLTTVAGFDVSAANADCAGFIAREIQRQLSDLKALPSAS